MQKQINSRSGSYTHYIFILIPRENVSFPIPSLYSKEEQSNTSQGSNQDKSGLQDKERSGVSGRSKEYRFPTHCLEVQRLSSSKEDLGGIFGKALAR